MQAWQYIALIGAVVAVTAVILPRRKETVSNASSSSQIEQLELAFEQFMDNMEQEQKDVVKLLQSSLQQIREEQKLNSELVSRLEQRNEQLEKQVNHLSNQLASTEAKIEMLVSLPDQKSREEQIIPNDSAERNDQLQQSYNLNSIHMRYPELFEMYNANKSIEAIAKKLGKNKGEVQLIIQLAMQEEKSRHA